MPPVRSSARVRAQVLSRRELVRGGAALTGGALVLPACVREEGSKESADTGAGEDTGVADPGLIDSIAPITPNAEFYVTSCCGTPAVDLATWQLTIADRGKVLAIVTSATLETLKARDKEHTLECIGGGPYHQAISNAVWTGLPLGELFAALGVTVPAGALELVITGADDYTTSLPVADVDRPLWLVWRMNGEPLPAEHGFPVRMLVPGRYGMKNPKWIVGLEFVNEPYLGYWETLGWSNDASYQPNTLVRSPPNNYAIPPGPARILGTAFAGDDPVTRVEISFDGGGSWVDAPLDYSPGADIWTLWHYDWEAVPGEYLVQVRCTTASGAASNPDPDGSGTLDGYDGSMEIELTVE